MIASEAINLEDSHLENVLNVNNEITNTTNLTVPDVLSNEIHTEKNDDDDHSVFHDLSKRY
jgi:hypothetical protein